MASPAGKRTSGGVDASESHDHNLDFEQQQSTASNTETDLSDILGNAVRAVKSMGATAVAMSHGSATTHADDHIGVDMPNASAVTGVSAVSQDSAYEGEWNEEQQDEAEEDEDLLLDVQQQLGQPRQRDSLPSQSRVAALYQQWDQQAFDEEMVLEESHSHTSEDADGAVQDNERPAGRVESSMSQSLMQQLLDSEANYVQQAQATAEVMQRANTNANTDRDAPASTSAAPAATSDEPSGAQRPSMVTPDRRTRPSMPAYTMPAGEAYRFESPQARGAPTSYSATPAWNAFSAGPSYPAAGDTSQPVAGQPAAQQTQSRLRTSEVALLHHQEDSKHHQSTHHVGVTSTHQTQSQPSTAEAERKEWLRNYSAVRLPQSV